MEQAKIWDEILLLIENRMSKQGFDTWFSQTRLKSLDNDKIVIELPSKFHRDWIKDKHWNILTDVIAEVTKKDSIDIAFEVPPQEQQKKVSKPSAKKEERTPLLVTVRTSAPAARIFASAPTSAAMSTSTSVCATPPFTTSRVGTRLFAPASPGAS